MSTGAPSFLDAACLIVTLRFKVATRQLSRRGALGTITSVLAAAALAGGLGWGSFWLFARAPGVSRDPVWLAFGLSLYCFLVSLFWVIWPVVAAQVDEAYEIGRLFAYPVRPSRLYAISTAVALVEPSVVFFYPALVGAALGLCRSLGPGTGPSVALIAGFVWMNVATGRCLLNLFLNLMTSRRSGEFLFAFFLLLLSLAALLPPVDASWLFERLSEFGASAVDLSVLTGTARALAATPPGWLARGLAAAAAGRTADWLGALAGMLAVGGFAWLVGLRLLKRFYRGGRGLLLLPSRRRARPAEGRLGLAIPGLPDALVAVAAREVRTLLGNPKARMLFAVPFFLLILIKIIGAPQLLLYLWGEAWAAVLLSLLSLYVLSVLSGQLFSNAFGYDGPAARLPYLAPAPLLHWLLGRNLAHGLFACLQVAGLGGILFWLLPDARPQGLLLPVCSFLFALPICLAVGNRLSCRYPRRFHLKLSRRDRPVGASVLWVLGALGACGLGTWLVLNLTAADPFLRVLGLCGLPVLGGLLYLWLLPGSAVAMSAERERIVGALTP